MFNSRKRREGEIGLRVPSQTSGGAWLNPAQRHIQGGDVQCQHEITQRSRMQPLILQMGRLRPRASLGLSFLPSWQFCSHRFGVEGDGAFPLLWVTGVKPVRQGDSPLQSRSLGSCSPLQPLGNSEKEGGNRNARLSGCIHHNTN